MLTRTTFRRAATTVVASIAVLTAGVPVAHAGADRPAGTGWAGIAREQVEIGMEHGWTAKGELDYPRGAYGRLPVVVLFHGSGHNDMDQTLPGGAGSTFVPITQAVVRRGYAVLRFNKRGVTGIGPVLTDDATQLARPEPYEQILRDAAAVVRFAARSARVDPSRIHLLGHSEGTQVAANLAAATRTYGIPEPAGVLALGVVGHKIRTLMTYQFFGVKLARLHEEFDVDGDGYLTYPEARDGLVGQPAAEADEYRKVLISGKQVNPGTDGDRDGRLAIDTEVGPVLRAASGVDAFPNLPGVGPGPRAYLADIARFASVTEDLPRFAGPTLLLNGENDVQTPARGALVADAAVAASGNKDHTVVTYPGIGHTMNRTAKFAENFGSPDPIVLKDIQRWLSARR